jgi:DNA repair protein RecO (recombination protein O)
MLQKTHAIVLSVTEYSEASIIVHAYTETMGLQSFLVNSVRKPKARFAYNLFQPLSLIELVAYIKKLGGLHRVADAAAHPSFQSIPYDIIKTTVAIFLGEVLYRSIKEEEANPELFHFVSNAIQLYDLHTEIVSGFHLCFMMQLTRYLGIYPGGRYSAITPWFDLQEGQFTDEKPVRHPYFLLPESAKNFDRLLEVSLENSGSLGLNGIERRNLLSHLVLYYELHHTQGAHIRSHQILAEVLH